MNICDNCQRQWLNPELRDIDDYSQRVGAGTKLDPTGQCPDCGALCYDLNEWNKLPEKVTVSTDADENWQNNAIQFPRLLAEIMATGALNEGSWGELLDSMDLESDQLSELFERAQKVWDEIKQRTVAA